VKSLSGGEKARFLLAKLMALPSNLLILDEPTNDLDVETLDLLQDILSDYDGTVLLVSHDRDFIDRIATTTIALEGQGRATAFPGGWSDYARQRVVGFDTETFDNAAKKPAAPVTASAQKAKPKLTFTEAKRLDVLPDLIGKAEAELAKLSTLLEDPALFTRDPVKFGKTSEMVAKLQAALQALEEEWMALEEKAG
jgi:ATP-binding cassette subfamily F protein uup